MIFRANRAICTFLAVIVSIAYCVGQEHLSWQLHYGPFASGEGFNTESLTVSPHGHAFLAYVAGNSIHLSEVQPNRRVEFDKVVAQSTSNALESSFTDYGLDGSKYTPATKNGRDRITVFGAEITPLVGFSINLAPWVNQFDTYGRPMWPKPVILDKDAVFRSWDVGPDGSVFVYYGNVNYSHLVTISNNGLITKDLSVAVDLDARHLASGDWVVGLPVANNEYTWGIVNGSNGAVKFQAPLLSSPDADWIPLTYPLPDGNVFVVNTFDFTNSADFDCEIYAPSGRTLALSATLPGGARLVPTGVTNSPYYLFGADDGGAFVIALSPKLEVIWKTYVPLSDDALLFREWADRIGVFFMQSVNEPTGSAFTTLTHIDSKGNPDWNSAYSFPSLSASVDTLASSESATYFAVGAGGLYQNGVQTFDTDFDLVRLGSKANRGLP